VTEYYYYYYYYYLDIGRRLVLKKIHLRTEPEGEEEEYSCFRGTSGKNLRDPLLPALTQLSSSTTLTYL
jgi:hypothetical protein